MQKKTELDKAAEYVSRVSRLLPAPTVAVELLGLFGDPDRDIDRIVELIGHEPSLTADLLKQSNSAVFGLNQPVTTVFEAVTRLGFYEVYSLVTALTSARTMSAVKTQEGLDVTALWRHSAMTAVAANAIARRIGQVEGKAFTVGLLHDLGKLVLASVEGSRYGAIANHTGNFGQDLIRGERLAFGTNHAIVGFRLLSQWKMPAELAIAIAHHHDWSEPAPDLPAVQGEGAWLGPAVALANILAHHLIDKAPDEASLPTEAATPMSLLELTPEDLPALLEQSQEGFDRVEGLLRINA